MESIPIVGVLDTWTRGWPDQRFPLVSVEQHATLVDAGRASDIGLAPSSFLRIGPDSTKVIVEDGRSQFTRSFTVIMNHDRDTDFWSIVCSCAPERPGLCRHCCYLLLRVSPLRQALVSVFIDNGEFRSMAVAQLVSRLESAQVLGGTQPSRQDADPADPADECPVCYDAFSDRRCVACGRCARLFHRACAARWGRSCPTCRDDDQFRDLASEEDVFSTRIPPAREGEWVQGPRWDSNAFLGIELRRRSEEYSRDPPSYVPNYRAEEGAVSLAQ